MTSDLAKEILSQNTKTLLNSHTIDSYAAYAIICILECPEVGAVRLKAIMELLKEENPAATATTGMNKKLLSYKQVATMLNVEPNTVLRWTKRGMLESVRIGIRSIRFEPEEVERFMTERGPKNPFTRKASGKPEASGK